MATDQPEYPTGNMTWQVLNHANVHNYAVGAYNWYDTNPRRKTFRHLTNRIRTRLATIPMA